MGEGGDKPRKKGLKVNRRSHWIRRESKKGLGCRSNEGDRGDFHSLTSAFFQGGKAGGKLLTQAVFYFAGHCCRLFKTFVHPHFRKAGQEILG